MRPPNVRIVERVNKDGSISYQVDAGFVQGKRHRKQFQSRQEAIDHKRKLTESRRKVGDLAFSLSTKEHVEAAEMFEMLKPVGAKATEAAAYFIRHNRPAGGPKTVLELIPEFLKKREEKKRSLRYRDQLRFKLEKFAAQFGNLEVSEVTRDQVEEWLDPQPFAAVTRNNYLRDLGVFFRFAQDHDYCSTNPLARIEKSDADPAPPEILSISQVQELLFVARSRKSKCDLIPYISIALFAGIRCEEIEKLKWSQIDLDEEIITVEAEGAKTKKRRNVKIQPNLSQWLSSYVGKMSPREPIVNSCWRGHFQDTTKAAGIDPWPHNALRHSFGSYHFALFRDIGVTAAEMGNSPGILHRHYKELVKPSDAVSYFGLVPFATGVRSDPSIVNKSKL